MFELINVELSCAMSKLKKSTFCIYKNLTKTVTFSVKTPCTPEYMHCKTILYTLSCTFVCVTCASFYEVLPKWFTALMML